MTKSAKSCFNFPMHAAKCTSHFLKNSAPEKPTQTDTHKHTHTLEQWYTFTITGPTSTNKDYSGDISAICSFNTSVFRPLKILGSLIS